MDRSKTASWDDWRAARKVLLEQLTELRDQLGAGAVPFAFLPDRSCDRYPCLSSGAARMRAQNTRYLVPGA